MYQYQHTHRYFAQIAGGMEKTGARELEELGATDVAEAYRGLYFDADPATLYRINYTSRLVTRVLAPLLTFDCHSARYLYKTAGSIDWSDFMTLDDTFAVFANVSHSRITHSKYAALRLKDAIVDQFRDRTGSRPSVDTRNPDVWFNVYVENNRAVISVGTTGGSLHRRGYRHASVEAPIMETVAASIIRLSEWDGSTPLYDPMCGSGTLLAEALMHHARIPSGYLRDDYGFRHLPDFDEDLWQRVKETADGGIRDVPHGFIAGSDVDAGAVEAARDNLRHLPNGRRIPVERKDFREIDSLEGTTIVCNPPYGVRMGKDEDLSAFYGALGDFLKQRCTGATAYIYFGKRRWIKHIGLRASWKKPLVNGALDGRLVKYVMY